MEVQFILEITSSVSLRSAPPVFPKGFQEMFEKFRGMDGNVFTLPFCGQHSCFSTSSGELKKKVASFLNGCDAYSLAAHSPVGMGTRQESDVRDFNISMLMLPQVFKTIGTLGSYETFANLTQFNQV